VRSSFSVLLLIFGVVTYYLFSKRKIREDLKGIIALILLIIFRARNIITSQEEAGKFSKSILFLPYFLLRSLWSLINLIAREVKLGFLDFLGAFRIKK